MEKENAFMNENQIKKKISLIIRHFLSYRSLNVMCSCVVIISDEFQINTKNRFQSFFPVIVCLQMYSMAKKIELINKIDLSINKIDRIEWIVNGNYFIFHCKTI